MNTVLTPPTNRFREAKVKHLVKNDEKHDKTRRARRFAKKGTDNSHEDLDVHESKKPP